MEQRKDLQKLFNAFWEEFSRQSKEFSEIRKDALDYDSIKSLPSDIKTWTDEEHDRFYLHMEKIKELKERGRELLGFVTWCSKIDKTMNQAQKSILSVLRMMEEKEK